MAASVRATPAIPTVASLVDEPTLHLRGIVAGGDERRSSRIWWIAASDLPDPTPFLGQDHVLLTTGRQLVDDDVRAPGYVRALVDAGVLALGFGTGVHADVVPASLVDACLAADLPLFEVPYEERFLAIIRWNAELATARDRWAADAQRSIAAAASRADGAAAVLRALARELGVDAALLDDRARVQASAGGALPDAVLDEVRAAVRTGRRTARAVDGGDGTWTLVQTLGGAGRIHGALALVGSAALDAPARSVATTAAGLLELALTTSQVARDRVAALEGAILEQALAGEMRSTSRLLARVGETLPAEPIVVAVAGGALGVEVEGAGSTLSSVRDGETLVVASAADRDAVVAALAGVDVTVGWSAPTSWSDASTATAQARTALGRARRRGAASATFSPADDGLLGLLDDRAVRAAATAHLGELLATEAGEADLALARTWFAHDCAWDAAARATGIHRHTLRGRVVALCASLGLDATRFADRATLWAWLQAIDEPVDR